MLVNQIAIDDFILLDAAMLTVDAKARLSESDAVYVIIERKEGDETYFYLYQRLEVLYNIENRPDTYALKDSLNLHEYSSTDTVSSREPVDLIDPYENYVVLEDGHPVSYLIAKDEDEVMEELDHADAMPIIGEVKPKGGIDFSDVVPPKPSSGSPRGGSGGGIIEPETSTENKSFEAYPSISNPGNIESKQAFKVYVGFSSDLDETLHDVQKVVIRKPKEDTFAHVSLMAIGAAIDNNRMKPLLLDPDAQVSFNCTPNEGVSEINLIATYFYEMQPVGTARRTIKVGRENEISPLPAPEVEEENKGCSLNIEGVMSEKGKTDITLTIIKDESIKQLKWKISASNPEIDEFATSSFSDAQSFAKVLGQELKREDYKSIIAENALVSLGAEITDLIPDVFFEVLKDVGEAIGRTPRILIWTDEPYIPWELAHSHKFSLDKNAPDFFGTQAMIGRWWLHPRVVSPPPTSVEVEQITAIAADYPFGSKVTPLEEAIKEKKFLQETFDADIVEAKKMDILEMTSKKAVPGHILHMALHGYSDPSYNEQKILVEDGELSPRSLIGAYRCGDVPPISFMFLNACQVGTAGSSLGQASGFPGTLLKKGMLGFIAPLWEVHDVQAREFAEHFYKETLNNKRPVAEVLLELRKGYNYEESLTPLAYLFYGHPGLVLDFD